MGRAYRHPPLCKSCAIGYTGNYGGKMYIKIDYPCDYLCICFTELAEPKYSNVSEILTFGNYEEAVQYGRDWCRSIQGYPAEAHFMLYELGKDR